MADTEAVVLTIWEFCFMTSAGVRMAHETSSAVPDAAAWTVAMGSRGEPLIFGLKLP